MQTTQAKDDKTMRFFSLKWLVLILLLSLALAIPIWGAQARKYAVPENLTVEIQPVEPISFSQPVKVKVFFTSKIGVTRNIDISFYASENLNVEPAKAKIDVLEEKAIREITVTLNKKGAIKPCSEKWIQVSYGHLPDYSAMMERVMSDRQEYSSTAMTSQLLGTLRACQDEGRVFRMSLTYDF